MNSNIMQRVRFILLLALITTVLMSCKTTRQSQCVHINLSQDALDSKELDLNIQSHILSLDNAPVRIGNIVDLAFNDSVCYILDDNGSITKLPLNDITSAQQTNVRDYSISDPMDPMALDLYQDTLFLLNAATASVLKYDTALKHIDAIPLFHTTLNILVFNDCILSDNLEFGASHLLILSDKNGSQIKSLIPVDSINEPDFFQWGTYMERINGKVHILDSKSNTLYKYDGNESLPLYFFDFGEYTLPGSKPIGPEAFDEYAISTHCFQLKDKILLSFVLKNDRRYCWYDIKSGSFKSGRLRNTSDGLPFYPRWQKDDELIGYESDSPGGNGLLIFFSIDPF